MFSCNASLLLEYDPALKMFPALPLLWGIFFLIVLLFAASVSLLPASAACTCHKTLRQRCFFGIENIKKQNKKTRRLAINPSKSCVILCVENGGFFFSAPEVSSVHRGMSLHRRSSPQLGARGLYSHCTALETWREGLRACLWGQLKVLRRTVYSQTSWPPAHAMKGLGILACSN